MHFAREGYPRIFALGILCLVFNLLGFPKLGVGFLLLTLFVAYFFRDPERVAPEDDRYLVAPADGRVVTIEQNVTNDRWVTSPSTRVGIFMSPLNVHVNRLPVSGVVESVRYQAGKFRPAFAEDATQVNEQNGVTIQDSHGRRVVFVQVAGILARRIVCVLTGGERVRQGERYGMIMLGSRVDLYCPVDAQITVQVGQTVKAGETIVAKYS